MESVTGPIKAEDFRCGLLLIFKLKQGYVHTNLSSTTRLPLVHVQHLQPSSKDQAWQVREAHNNAHSSDLQKHLFTILVDWPVSVTKPTRIDFKVWKIVSWGIKQRNHARHLGNNWSACSKHGCSRDREAVAQSTEWWQVKYSSPYNWQACMYLSLKLHLYTCQGTLWNRFKSNSSKIPSLRPISQSKRSKFLSSSKLFNKLGVKQNKIYNSIPL